MVANVVTFYRVPSELWVRLTTIIPLPAEPLQQDKIFEGVRALPYHAPQHALTRAQS